MKAINVIVYIFGIVIAVILGYLWMAEKDMIEKAEFYHWFVDVLNLIVA